jgi:hypothetical protein
MTDVDSRRTLHPRSRAVLARRSELPAVLVGIVVHGAQGVVPEPPVVLQGRGRCAR